ncbi:Pentatricopeptide repeat-containing protein At2g16880 [Linum grandiflorum]
MEGATGKPPPLPVASATSALVEFLTKILISEKEPLQKLNSYIPHISTNSNLLLSLLSSKQLARMPATLISLLRWSQSHLPSALARSPLPLLAVIPSLIAHHRFDDSKTLMKSFIASDKQNTLHYHILHPDSRTQLSRAVYDVSIGAYVAAGRPHHAADIFKKMKRLRLKPNLLTCNTLLNALVRYPSLHAVSLSKTVLVDVISLGVRSKFEEALELVAKMGEYGCSPDNITYNTILDGMCKKGKLSEARNLLLDMKSRDLFPNRTTFNILISGYCKLGWLKEAAQVIELMAVNKVSADIWSYNMLIDGLCKVGRISEAFKLRDEMEKLKLFPDVVTYNTLIDGCFMFGSSVEAFRLVEDMEDKGLKPTAVTHNTLVKWFVKEGKMDEAAKAVRKMEDSGFSPDCITYNTLIAGYCKTGKMDEAFRVMHDMNTKPLKMDSITLNTVIHALCLEKKLDEAYDLLCTARIRNGLFPDETTYNTIIHGYCWEKQIEKAFQFHNKMVENSFKPDVFTCNILLRGLSTGGMLDKALSLFHKWMSKGKQVDLVTYNTVISSLCRERRFEEAFTLFDDMEEKGLDPDCYTYNAIITGLTDAGRIDDFEDFVSKRLKKDHIEAQSLQLDKTQDEGNIKTCLEIDKSSISYSEKISELCAEGKYKDALKHFQESREKSIMLQKSTYIHLMSGLIRRRKRTSEAATIS